MERALFALVANRAVAPASKLLAADWVTHDVAVPGLTGMDKDQAMRVEVDLIFFDSPANQRLEEPLARRTAVYRPIDAPYVPFEEHRDWPVNRDTTSTYFEPDDEDGEDDSDPGRPHDRKGAPGGERGACAGNGNSGNGNGRDREDGPHCGATATRRTTHGTCRKS